jgi:hypothetical protein
MHCSCMYTVAHDHHRSHMTDSAVGTAGFNLHHRCSCPCTVSAVQKSASPQSTFGGLSLGGLYSSVLASANFGGARGTAGCISVDRESLIDIWKGQSGSSPRRSSPFSDVITAYKIRCVCVEKSKKINLFIYLTAA